ncbi:hypothetical protein [Legionella waltersii]|uniref:Leucine-rich repeat-containing protein (Substrate of the Dot/Icm secretion system) n=1 Tax=Legionella waltersii TaxID=66969 RepID=A0A0W1AKE2_9GAMM|nr:hypothetical protein [Legionella waltersii]KTD81750.1 leucine-rich repeat-containing protein (substrate of the Dot/Icm secretion system) [Legionella waltersii]SNU97072.1 Leucine-rich repeat-containing protein Substrate of the Dot/Icm secretion system [Legionella waltersii]
MGWNILDELGPDGLKTALQGIPENITSLILSANGLFTLRDGGLKTGLQGIPKNITTLNLSVGFLFDLGANDLKTALQGIPENVATLALSNNSLNALGVKGLKTVLQGIPENIISLDLSKNDLYTLNLLDLVKALATIPNHVTSVHLGDNGLFIKKTTKEIDAFLQLLGENRHRYNLSGNGESQLARALAPMALLTQENSTNNPAFPTLPKDVVAHILSFLDTKHNPENKIEFFESQLQLTIEAIATIKSKRISAPINPCSDYKTHLESTNNAQPILQIPQEVFLKHIPLNAQDIKNLRLTCSGFSFFRYKSAINRSGKGDAYLLMEKVIHFRIKEATEIVRNNPEALFMKICYEVNEKVDVDSSATEFHSPLQRAFRNLDTYMWNSLYETIKEDPELLKQYKSQLSEVNAHFDIQPLISAYDNYLTFYENEKPELNHIDEDSPEAVKAFRLFRDIRTQQDLLPMHMIYEMCRPNAHMSCKIDYDKVFTKEYFNAEKHTWLFLNPVLNSGPSANSHPDAGRFEISNNPPPPSKILCFIEEQRGGITLPVNKLKDLEQLVNKGLGALVRGDYTFGAFPALAYGTAVEDDQQLFLKLYEIRLKEFLKHKELLFGNSCTKERTMTLNQ